MEGVPKNSYFDYRSDIIEVLRAKYNLQNDRLTQSINLLEEWVNKQNHFTHKVFEPKYYETILLARKGSLEKTKFQIERLLTLRTLMPEFFIYENAKEKFSALTKYANYFVMPCMTEDYKRIIILKVKDILTPELNMTCSRLIVSTAEYLRHHDRADGFISILDYRDINLLDHIKCIDWDQAQHMKALTIEGYGARVKAVHLISNSKFVELFMSTAKSFIPAKIASRFNVHKSVEELQQFIDKKYLPEDYGGSQKPIKELQDEMIKLLCSEEHQNYMKKVSGIRTDESQRPAGESDRTMDLPGSFRTLTVD